MDIVILLRLLHMHKGSVLIPSIDKSMEGPGHRFKYIRWGTLLPLDVVSKKGDNVPGTRILKIQLCHMHSFMHSSIPPMRYRSFDLHQLFVSL